MSSADSAHHSIAVIGAGMAGLTTARELTARGVDTVVLDKGRSVGGRLATRRIGDARLDHGAQFFTVRTDEFAAVVDDWLKRGLAHEWCRGFANDDGHPRYVGTAGMNSLAKDLADGLDVRCDHLVFSASREATDGPWLLTLDDGRSITSDVLVCTAPVAQSFSLLFETVDGLPRDLFDADYDRTLGILAALDSDPGLPEPGAVRDPSADVSMVVDNARKGVSPVHAITLHASADWSETHWDDDPDDLESALHELLAPWRGSATVTEAQVKRWRFATPRRTWPEPCWVSTEHQVVLAGDAYAGPRVEGAFTSGRAAASAACTLLR